jgi:hypothetical protein
LIDPGCEDALRELERRGYPVWRIRGYSAIDAARNQMATDALGQGFEELMWIDSDVVFDPDDVEKLRSHNLPLVCGLYPKKGPRQFACEFLPDSSAIRFGKNGGLIELRYCGFGFVHTRKELYATVQDRLVIPLSNQRFDAPLVPFFEPMTIEEPGGRWSLGEDYAFCERVRRTGLRVMADTTIRLWHVGPYRYGWEDAGGHRDRFADYTFRPAGTRPVWLPIVPGPPSR